jgi:hypothetical protein
MSRSVSSICGHGSNVKGRCSVELGARWRRDGASTLDSSTPSA